jgi:thiamine monophosphate kinase
MRLDEGSEELLRRWFTRPTPQLGVGHSLANSRNRITAMDNTDGLSQSLHELADASALHFAITEELLPLHEVSEKVATFLGENVLDLIMGPGADFNLVGTADKRSFLDELGLYWIGRVEEGNGVSVRSAGGQRELKATGWDYFTRKGTDDSHRS